MSRKPIEQESADGERPENGSLPRTTGLKLVSIAAEESDEAALGSEKPTLTAADADLASLPPPRARSSRPPPHLEPDPYLGCTIDNRYKVESVLGEGGMGVVYLCRHKIIDKKVAMKILRADLAREPEVTERFLIEAKAASSIGNQHIIDISDFGQLPDGSAYFVMEYLDGAPMSALIGEGNPMGLERILHVGIQLAEGLAAAHNAGHRHRRRHRRGRRSRRCHPGAE
jgi:serine/threonine-protein kinase